MRIQLRSVRRRLLTLEPDFVERLPTTGWFEFSVSSWRWTPLPQNLAHFLPEVCEKRRGIRVVVRPAVRSRCRKSAGPLDRHPVPRAPRIRPSPRPPHGRRSGKLTDAATAPRAPRGGGQLRRIASAKRRSSAFQRAASSKVTPAPRMSMTVFASPRAAASSSTQPAASGIATSTSRGGGFGSVQAATSGRVTEPGPVQASIRTTTATRSNSP